MKTAVVFFVVTVFTTLFPESSTVPVLSTAVAEGSGLLDGVLDIAGKPVDLTVPAIIASKDATLLDLIKEVYEALKKAKDSKKQKAALTECKNWLLDVKAQLDVLHANTLAAVASGTKEDLGNAIVNLSAVIKQRSPEIAEHIALLAATPGAQTSAYLPKFTTGTTYIASAAVIELQLLRTRYVTASL